jgi:hypothetical protein
MRIRTRAGLLTVGTAMVLTVGVSPAHAASYSGSCTTTGAFGRGVVEGWSEGDYDIPSVSLSASDTLADGHHVRVRLVTDGYGGNRTYFPWHANYDGASTTLYWYSSASVNYAISGVSVQVARYEGDDQLNFCEAFITP